MYLSLIKFAVTVELSGRLSFLDRGITNEQSFVEITFQGILHEAESLEHA